MLVNNLKCNGKTRPLQADCSQVSFSFQIAGCENGTMQSAYEIEVTAKEEIIWQSGKVLSDRNLYVPYGGPQLQPESRYWWRVRVWDRKDRISEWSYRTWFETDIGKEGWKAEWIGYDRADGKVFDKKAPFYCADDFKLGRNTYFLPPVPYLRKTFELSPEKEIASAKLYETALGLLEIEINGHKIKQGILAPGFSDYRKTVYTRACHVEEYLKPGGNGIGIILADGWYAGYMGLNNREWYGSKPRACVQLQLTYEDGSKEVLVTDQTWKASYGALREADLYQGETCDGNLEWEGWSEADFSDSAWESVDTGSECDPEKIPHPGPPIVEHSHIIPDRIPGKNDRILLEFTEYVCGVCSFTVRGEKGSRFSVRHAEMLGPAGELHLDGNRSARCEDTYILKGIGEETFRPRFTWHGFRYAEITCEGTVEFLKIEGIQEGTALFDPTAFSCSDSTADAVFGMIRATEKANLMDIPTDCTARDERLGWGLEGNHFMYAMTYMNDQRDAILKWNQDIWDGQRENGVLEATAPAVVMKDIEPFIGDLQSNHGLYMVHALYRMYGDTDSVKERMVPLKHYFDYLDRNSDRNLRYATSCDWLGILEETDHSDVNHGYGESSALMIGTAHYAVAARMMTELCEAVQDSETEKYKQLYLDIKKAFCANFVERNGLLRKGKQGDYLMALSADLIPQECLPTVVDHFRKELMKAGYIRWFGGTTTTPYLLMTLKKYGMTDLANQFITAVTYPSIGYMKKCGFDTIWERMDAIDEKGALHPQVMNAMCHEGYASIAKYYVAGIAGIEAKSAGFKEILLEPGVSREITQAAARFHSPYGEIRTGWEWKNGSFTLKSLLPANTTGVIRLPGIHKPEFSTGTPTDIRYENGKTVIEVGSGYYTMTADWNEL